MHSAWGSSLLDGTENYWKQRDDPSATSDLAYITATCDAGLRAKFRRFGVNPDSNQARREGGVRGGGKLLQARDVWGPAVAQ